MDLSAFPPFAVALDGLYSLVLLITRLAVPVAGAAAPALAIVLLTALVRLVLTPVAVSQARAEIGRRRLAPKLAELRRRIPDREALGRAVAALYASEKTSPIAGCLPTLAQAPVLTAVYSLFTHPVIGGHANALLTQSLWGAPFAANLVAALGAGIATAWPVLALLVVLAALVELNRRAARRYAGIGMPAAPASLAVAVAARVLPFATVAFAAFLPFAGALYVASSSAWTLGERALLRRLLA